MIPSHQAPLVMRKRQRALKYPAKVAPRQAHPRLNMAPIADRGFVNDCNITESVPPLRLIEQLRPDMYPTYLIDHIRTPMAYRHECGKPPAFINYINMANPVTDEHFFPHFEPHSNPQCQIPRRLLCALHNLFTIGEAVLSSGTVDHSSGVSCEA